MRFKFDGNEHSFIEIVIEYRSCQHSQMNIPKKSKIYILSLLQSINDFGLAFCDIPIKQSPFFAGMFMPIDKYQQDQ
jgi:hypothetical protein